MAAGSIVVDLLMRTGSFETDTDRAAKSLARFKKEAAQTAKEVGAVLGVAAAAAGTALVAMTKQAIDSADALNDLSERTGIAIESLSALQYAAEVGDVANEELAAGLVKLARVMSEAADGAAAPAAAFDALGVAVKNVDGTLRGTDAVLADLANRFAGYADGAEKTALAQEIFGKSGAQLIPLLNQGADGMQRLKDEAKALGIVVGTDAARAAGELNDTLLQLSKATESIGLRMTTELLPTLQAVASELAAARQEGGPFADILDVVSAAARTAVEALVVLGANLSFVFKGVGREIGAVAAQVVALASLDIRGFRAISDAVREDAQRARAELDALERRILGGSASRQMADALGINDIGRGLPDGRPRAPRLGSVAGGAAGRGAAAQRAVPASYQDGVAQAVGRAIENADVVRARELADQIAYLDDLFFSAGLAAEVYESAMRKLTGQNSETKDATSEFLREQERLAELLGSTASAELERQREDMHLLAKAYQEGRISVQQYTEAVQARLGQTGAQAEKTKTLAEDLGFTFTSAFEDAIVSGGKFSDVLKGLEQDLLRLITRKMITEPLGNFITSALQSMTGGGAGGGGFFAGIGNFISSLFGGGRAYGGPVNAGTMYRVNERGSPEMLEMDGKEFLLMGNRRGFVNPNSTPARSSGNTWSPVFNMTFAAGTSVASATQAGAAVARRVQAAAQRNG